MSHSRLLDHAAAVEHPHMPSGPSLWEVLWHRKSYIALGVVIGLALGVLYYSMAARSYETSAQILVLKKRPDKPISASGSTNTGGAASVVQADDFLDTHQTVIRSSLVVNNAIAKASLTDLPTFRDSARPARDLMRSLKVSRDRDRTAGRYSMSQILNISFSCSQLDDCGTVLSAVIDSYIDFLSNSTQGSSKEALDLIRKARDLVQNDLEKKEKEYAEFRRNTPVLWKTQAGTNLHQERLAAIDAQRSGLAMRAAQVRATLDAVDAASKQGRSRAELLEIVSALPAQAPLGRDIQTTRGVRVATAREGSISPAQVSLEQELIQLQLQEGKLLEDYGSEHPEVKAVRERKQTIRSLLAPSTTPQAETAEQRQRDARAKENAVDLKIGQMKQELQENRRTTESLSTLFQSELQEAKKVFPYETQDDSFRRSIDRSQALYDNVIKRLQELDLVSNFGGFDAQVITPPTEPEKVSPRGSLVLPMSLLLGLVLGCGLVYLAETTDRSFRSTEDIRRRLGVPVMGLIPVLKPDSKASRTVIVGEALLDSNLYAWYYPKSKESEAYRGVRTALYFSTRGGGRKVIQITSPNVGDGKSTLAANLAVSIAQSGKRVLLVDADLRRPRVDKLFGVANEVGFSSVLAGDSDPPEVIQATAVPGLWVLPCGALPPNPAELLTSPRLGEMLAWMRDHYDYVLIDTPPLLAVTDPGVVGPQVDGVLLTLRMTKKGRLEAERAREALRILGVTLFGVVVNAAALSQGTYSYGYYNGAAPYYEDAEKNGNRETPSPSPRSEHAEGSEPAPETNGTRKPPA
jgi:capsular exopolysaccharide synthesis family protein